MHVLQLHGVGVTRAKVVLRDVSFSIGAGFAGLVGANGAGKTTLLGAIAGDVPYEGRIEIRPGDALVVTCPQEVEDLTGDIRAFDDAGGALHARLELAPLDRWTTLSPGEKKRWQIGAALAREPDVLLLDEPTNHLDDAGRRILVNALKRFRGIGLVVSHDRALLDELATTILRVHDAQVTTWAGNYSDAVAHWEAGRRADEDAYAAANGKVKAVARKLDAARHREQAAAANRSTKTRMRNIHDSEARGIGAANVAEWAAASAGKQVAARTSELDRAIAQRPRLERDRTAGRELFAGFERAPTPILFHTGGLTIHRDDRIRIAGPNGAGKTTLIKKLLPEPREKILYLPQELTREEIATLSRSLRDMPREAKGKVLSMFSALGSDPDRLSSRTDDRLSPGEARKLLLAKALAEHAYALVLDEPTNHLDLPSIERIERALVAYPGCIVLASHDDRFAAALTTQTIELAGRGWPDAS